MNYVLFWTMEPLPPTPRPTPHPPTPRPTPAPTPLPPGGPDAVLFLLDDEKAKCLDGSKAGYSNKSQKTSGGKSTKRIWLAGFSPKRMESLIKSWKSDQKVYQRYLAGWIWTEILHF